MVEIISMLVSVTMVFLWLNERAWRKMCQRQRDEARDGWVRALAGWDSSRDFAKWLIKGNAQKKEMS